jgi:triacylglycerol lipase
LQPGGEFDPQEPVHIIAHSMGGLDARFLLSPDNPENMADRIISLTTISAPHKGSPIADVLVAIEDAAGLGDEGTLLGHALHAALTQAHIPTGGLRNLTTEGVREFNARFRDSDDTKKFSAAGVGRGIQVLGIHIDTCVALRLAHRIIKERTGEDNDGLVSLGSATWGEGPELWPADHADEIGHNLDLGLQAPPAHFDYLARYEALVDRLRQL